MSVNYTVIRSLAEIAGFVPMHMLEWCLTGAWLCQASMQTLTGHSRVPGAAAPKICLGICKAMSACFPLS